MRNLNFQIIKLGFIGVCLGLLFFVNSAQAAFDFDVSPTDGSNNIRFGNINLPTVVNAEVRIRITSTENQQYQVFQRVQEPFINERGEQLERQIVQTSAIIGSNSSGTLYVQDVERMNYSDQLIYTSNPDGLSDSFTLVYQIDPQEVKKTGNFFGKVLYTLRPISGGQQEEIVLNAFMESYNDEWSIQVKSDSGPDTIALSTESELKKENEIEISFSGHSGGNIKIYQEIDQYPADEEGKFLDPQVVQFSVAGAENGETDYFQPQSLERRRLLIYEGDAREDKLAIQYVIDEKGESAQLAGVYRGTLKIFVESDMVNETYPFEFGVDIRPVFELTAEYPPGGVSFKNLLPDSPPQTKEILVTVHTNLGKPYEVIQNVSGPMTNEEGQMLEPEYFTMKGDLLSGESGEMEAGDFTAVPEGDVTLFSSDKQGLALAFSCDVPASASCEDAGRELPHGGCFFA